MSRCSWWVIVGFAVLVAGLAYSSYLYWYATVHVPDFPQTMDSKRFIHTPRGDAQLGAVITAAFIIVTTSFITLVGVIRGPRTKGCLLAGLAGPALLAIPFAAIFLNDLVRWARAI